MKAALTIGYSSPTGGAGILSDIKVFEAHGVYGMTALTAVAAQNTQGIFGFSDLPPQLVTAQLDAVFNDIVPDSAKIGVVYTADIIEAVSETLRLYNTGNIVLDPIIFSHNGYPLLKPDAIEALTKKLFPLADIITPDFRTASMLGGVDIHSEADIPECAKAVYERFGVKTFIKQGGGLSTGCLYDGAAQTIGYKKTDSLSAHDDGDILSGAIAANLALGCDIKTSVYNAVKYFEDTVNRVPC